MKQLNIKKNMILPIDKKVPVPEDAGKRVKSGRRGDGRQETMLALRIKESFWLPTSRSSASTLRWWAKAREPEREWTLAEEEGGVRIWRIK